MTFVKGHKINIGNKFRLGKCPWNKNTIGICKPNDGSFKKGERKSIKTEFVKGGEPWNKNKKGWMAGEQNPFYGKKHTKDSLKKMSKAQEGRTGEKSANWKGGYVIRDRKMFDINRKGAFTEKQWTRLKEKYGNMCLCCKRCEPEIKLEADHVIPVAKWKDWADTNTEIKYGCGDIENIQPLCRNCNGRKFTKIIDYRK
jgi:hypothetical protein